MTPPTLQARRHRATGQDRERGSVAVWAITAAMTLTLLVGLAVALGGQVYAKQRAQDIAAQAARAGGQQLHPGTAIRGQGAVLDPAAATAAARAYLAAVPDVTGTATVHDETLVVADTSSTYTTKFLRLIGITSLTVTGHAEVQTTRAADGLPR